MTTTITNQIRGIRISEAVKAPVLTASTANLALSGLQTVSGVVLAEGDRVLVKDQTDATENGIYDASTSAWQRSPDFDGNDDIVNGTLILSTDSDLAYRVTSDDPIVIGTDDINIESILLSQTQESIGAILYPRTAAESAAGVTPVNYAYAPGKARRYGITGVGNEQTRLQDLLNCGEKVVDGEWIATTINTSVTLPAGVSFVNANVVAGAAGINLVLVNTLSKVFGKLTGTGTVSVTERGIYPAANAVTDVELNIEVSNLTYGVHGQPLSGTALVDSPKRWYGHIYVHDIVGTVGASEGYGLLLSSGDSCVLTVHAKNIARHCVYLSAGSSFNDITLDADACGNYAVQLSATGAQRHVVGNTVRIKAKNLTTAVAGQSGAIAINGLCDGNLAIVDVEGNATTYEAVRVEGGNGVDTPIGNQIINGNIRGQFTGADVIRLLNADGTIVAFNQIRAYATADVIALRRSGTNSSTHGGYIYGNYIDAQGQAIKGIYDEINTVPSYIGQNQIRNNSSALRVDDKTSGLRTGFSRRAVFSGTSASVSATATLDVSASINDSIQVTGRRTFVWLTGSSVNYTTPSVILGLSPADETHAGFRIYNAHSAGQTFDYEGVVEGD